MLWAALSMGILASIHCVGMCGPLAMAVTRGYSPNFWVNAGIPYHLGRITTYALLGAGMGSLSVSVAWAGYQQVFSILMGILMLVVIIGSWLHHSERISWKPLDRIFLRLRKKMGHLLQPHTPQLTFNLGILNGFLPCGWVYMALMGAMATGSMMESIGFMTLFGLGTFPALFLLTTLGNRMLAQHSFPISHILKLLSLGIAVYLIFRGIYIDPTHAHVAGNDALLLCK